ncbi:subtilase family protein [Synechococcus sp. BIOS-U3-1]|nr:subtilase family protein [Synechococcus sp. BIOS-U3-1]
MTSLIEIKRGDLYSDTMTFRELPESGLILRRFSIVDEKTNLFATLSDLPTDLDLYIGKINPATNEPYPTPILTAILPYKVYNSSTNPGNESEKIFAQLEPGEYWIGIKDNINLTTEEKNKPFKLSLDAQTFDKTTRLSNDPELVRQWHLFNTGLPQLDEWFTAPNVDIGAPEAWKLGFDAEIPIAIIDGGIDINHPDLINNLWTNPKEIAGNNLDDDNNGYKDDLHGWNFADGTANVMPDRHGTHVAGITGAKGNNGIGVSGVAWNTQLMTLDVFGNADRASLQAQIDAIKYAVNNGAKVINMSLGGHFKITPEEYLNNSNNEKFAEVLNMPTTKMYSLQLPLATQEISYMTETCGRALAILINTQVALLYLAEYSEILHLSARLMVRMTGLNIATLESLSLLVLQAVTTKAYKYRAKKILAYTKDAEKQKFLAPCPMPATVIWLGPPWHHQ